MPEFYGLDYGAIAEQSPTIGLNGAIPKSSIEDIYRSNLYYTMSKDAAELERRLSLSRLANAQAEAAPKINYVDTTPIATEKNNKSGKLSSFVIEKIAKSAIERGVDPYQALAVAMVETNLARTKTSDSVANPMQMNIAMGFNVDGVDAAIDHLKNLQTKSDGSMSLALRKYNGMGKSPYPNAGDYSTKVKYYAEDLAKHKDVVGIVNSLK